MQAIRESADKGYPRLVGPKPNHPNGNPLGDGTKLGWPANSPDMNHVIEQMWNWLRRGMEPAYTSLEALRIAPVGCIAP